MSEQNKTQVNSDSVELFLSTIKDKQKRADCVQLVSLFETVSGHDANMWGKSMVGFGEYHYRYDSGREGDFMRLGFAPRSQHLAIYIIPGFSGFEDLLSELGSHTVSKTCLYIKKLSEVDLAVLTQIVSRSLDIMAQQYPHNS